MATMTRHGRAALASAVGTTVEWYDFFIYGTAAGLVFNTLFFPTFDPVVGTILSFGSVGAAFVFRPVGGLIFSHFGDKYGRKRMLVITLTIMGVTTFGVGLLPSYAAIGALAPVLLVALRCIQGLALGGEYGGALVIAAEEAPPHKRGLYASFVQLGGPGGLILGNVAFLVVQSATSVEALQSWGWRIPFFVGGAFVLFGLYIRTQVEETRSFDMARKNDDIVEIPSVVVLRDLWPRVLLLAGSYVSLGVTFYTANVFGLTYGTMVGFSPGQMLSLPVIGMVVCLATIPLFGAMSDRVGRKPLFYAGLLVMGTGAFPWFWMMNTGGYAWAVLAYTVICAGFALCYGPMASFYAEVFTTRVRYSGLSISYTLGTLASNAVAPVVATLLLSATNSYVPVAMYMVSMAGISLVCTRFLPEGRDTFDECAPRRASPDYARTSLRGAPPS